jgi:hypothetical protein
MFLLSVSKVLKAHATYLTPESFQKKELGQALFGAKEAFRAAFLKIAADKTDAKKEIAYGVLTGEDISTLFKQSRKMIYPLLGLGTVAAIISEFLAMKGVEENFIPEEDIRKAVIALEKSSKELNELCREAVEHISCTLQLGKYAKPSIFTRLFSKKQNCPSDNENASDIGTEAFLVRFDAGLAKFAAQRTENFSQFYDEAGSRPTQGLFLVLCLQFLLHSVADDLHILILYVDDLKSDGHLSRKRFVYPKMKTLRKVVSKIFHHDSDEVQDGFATEEGDIYTTKFSTRTNRILSIHLI